MRKTLLFSWLLPAALASPLAAEPPTIFHRPFGCAVADRFPLLEARFAPAADVATARVLFQTEGALWYSVRMKPEGSIFTGILPKPRKSLKSFRYYIEVVDKALVTNHTVQYSIAVVDSPAACKGKLLAGPLASASVLLQGPRGISTPPAGFSTSGVVTVAGESAEVAAGRAASETQPAVANRPDTNTDVSGSTGTAGPPAAAAKTGAGSGRGAVRKASGGIGAPALVLGGLGLAGGAAAVAASRRGNDGPVSTPGTSGNGQPTSYDIAFLPSPPGLDVTSCAGSETGNSTQSPTGFSSLRVTPDASGGFNTLWPVAAPAVRAVGQALSATFQATLTCFTSDQGGSITATGSNSGYSGTFQFGTQRGQVTITRAP